MPISPDAVQLTPAKSLPLSKGNAAAKKGVAVVTHPDIRWGRCDIKTVGLLPNAATIGIAQAALDHRGDVGRVFHDLHRCAVRWHKQHLRSLPKHNHSVNHTEPRHCKLLHDG